MISYLIMGRTHASQDMRVRMTPWINCLLVHLSPNRKELTPSDVFGMVSGNGHICLAAEHPGILDPKHAFFDNAYPKVGMATLSTYTKLGARVGVIEDVVVDRAHRGKGIGKGLMNMLIAEARTLGLTRLQLTSRPSRNEAHGLYGSLGFEQVETSVFRLTL